ncbi:hypothetical protein [Parabacteroides faecis]|uniref:hypothetical protein n=1 Tax=Parabacteroides faecis TaxID=1217282 RepID=UPI003521E7E6
MKICGIECTKDTSSKDLIIVNIIPKNPNIELCPNYKLYPTIYAIKITVQTQIKNTKYASVAYYIPETEIPEYIEKEFYTQLLIYSVKDHIESIYKETSERKPLSFYERMINFISSL